MHRFLISDLFFSSDISFLFQVSLDKSGLDEASLQLEERRKYLLREFENLKQKKNSLMTKDSEITEKWTLLSSSLTRINEKKTTLQKHDAEIEKVCKTLTLLFTSL